jgi:GNAT superfamily N-acetyltransferase
MIDFATSDDLTALADMLHALNAYHAVHLPERFHTGGDSAQLCGFFEQALAEGARILLYRTEAVPRGYLMWRRIDRSASVLEHGAPLALLDHVHVEPIWRRRGLGTRLIARFESEIRSEGCTGWITKVHAFNDPSAALMRGAGADLSVRIFEKRLGSAG